jgi:cystine transport system substrate-binding protein
MQRRRSTPGTRLTVLAAAGTIGLVLALSACQPAAPTSVPAKPTAAPAQPTAAPAAVPTTAPAQPAAPAATGDLLGQVKSRGVLRVANTQANPPWNFLDEANKLAGYDIDVANELAKRLGIGQVEFIGSNFQSFIPGVQTDKFDIVISGQTITDERKQQVDFSDPYEVNGVSIFVNATNDSITTLEHLAGRRIAVTAGGTQEIFAREKIPNADVKTYENGTLALTDVGLGRADAYLGSRFVGSYLAEKNGLKVKPTPGFLEKEVNAMSFKKGEAAFKAEVDKALSGMIADGTLSSISKKWLGGLDMVEELKALPKS